MILTNEQVKWLEADGDEQFRFIGQNRATKEEKSELKDLDDSYLDLNGAHLISNFEDLR